MAFGVNHTTVALAAYDGSYFLHFRGNVNLAHCRSRIFTAVALSHITQGTCAAQVADRIARRMAKHIIGNGDKRIFFSEHTSVLADKGKAVYIGINNYAQVKTTATHTLHYATKILLQRLRIMLEIAIRLAI